MQFFAVVGSERIKLAKEVLLTSHKRDRPIKSRVVWSK
jgi:hypothetical protein